MSEKTRNSVPVKVSAKTYDSLNDEQNRIRKKTGQKPALADLLDQAWQAWLEGAITSEVKRFTTSKDNEPDIPSTRIAPESAPVVNVDWHESGLPNWGEYREAVEELIYILQHGLPGMAEDIRGNLKWFALAARVANERASGGDAKAAPDYLETLLARADALVAEHRRGGAGTRGVESGAKPPKKRTG